MMRDDHGGSCLRLLTSPRHTFTSRSISLHTFLSSGRKHRGGAYCRKQTLLSDWSIRHRTAHSNCV